MVKRKGLIAIYTYEDLVACGDDEYKRASFVMQVIEEHKSSKAYQFAKDAQSYYDGENPRIMKLEKIIYDYLGIAHRDLYSANHKIPSQFFGIVVDQEVSYLLRNGITWNDEETGKKLGKDLSRRCADLLEYAAIDGTSFGFWNMDHIEVFRFADTDMEPGFAPLYGASDGKLKAGVRYWQIDSEKPQFFTLYELDGFTEYQKPKNGQVTISQDTQTYKQIITRRKTDNNVVGFEPGGNYDGFPIVPLRYKRNGQSELSGKRNTLDALDLVTSKMINNVDEGNLIYWVLTNCSAMDEEDDVAFLKQLKMTHVVHADGDEGAKAEAQSIEAPFEGTDKAIERLEKRLYKDFRAFDENTISTGNQTATAIKASYVGLDGKTDKNEDNITDFLSEICELAGIDDDPTYTRSKIINTQEEVQTVLSAAEYTGDDYTTKKVLTILGDADQYDEIQRQKDAEASDRYKQLEKELEDQKNQNQNQNEPGGNEE